MQKDPKDPVLASLNDDIGHTTRSILNFWLNDKPQADQGLSPEMKDRLTEICVGGEKYRPGRTVLAMRATRLFSVDRDWTCKYLLPSFQWATSEEEARFVWAGFLVSPYIYPALWKKIKENFIETSKHYDVLGRYRSSYADLLVMMSVDHSDFLSQKETEAIIRELPDESWREIARRLYMLFDGTDRNRKEYWEKNIKKFMQSLLKDHRDRDRTLSEDAINIFARMCIVEPQLFCDIFNEVKEMLQKMRAPYMIMRQLNETDICKKYPSEALCFLNKLVIPSKLSPFPKFFTESLDKILSQDKQLQNKSEYKVFFAQCEKRDYKYKS